MDIYSPPHSIELYLAYSYILELPTMPLKTSRINFFRDADECFDFYIVNLSMFYFLPPAETSHFAPQAFECNNSGR
jgi:hypothetical protein